MYQHQSINQPGKKGERREVCGGLVGKGGGRREKGGGRREKEGGRREKEGGERREEGGERREEVRLLIKIALSVVLN